MLSFKAFACRVPPRVAARWGQGRTGTRWLGAPSQVVMTMLRKRREFGAFVRLGGRDSGDVKDGVIDCPSFDERTFDVSRNELDKGVQVRRRCSVPVHHVRPTPLPTPPTVPMVTWPGVSPSNPAPATSTSILPCSACASPMV